jgi:hypothetical protein
MLCTGRRSRSNAASGSLRYARLPAEDAPVIFGVHGAVAARYGRREAEYQPNATTLDYVVAAAAG